jgi:ABC-type uncharacterized transport system involved in gliding motility auxiliary subunit
MNKKQQLTQQLISAVLFVTVIVMLGWLSVRFKTELDWTAGKRNTLTEASVKQLESMPDRITFYSFNYSGDEGRKALEQDLRKYRAVKKDIEVVFIDPAAQPQKVREYNISFAGEVVVEYQGRRENLRASTEQAVTTALQRLSYSGETWIGVLEGHGERSFEDASKQDQLGKFGQTLRDKGLKVQPLNLVQNPRIPDNVKVMVIASPQRAPVAGEVAMIKDFVERGGNLLWLADPDYPAGFGELAQALGVTWLDGYAIFPEYELLGTGHPGFYLATGYPPNPVTAGFEQISLFPLTRALSYATDKGWVAQPLLQSIPEAWLETGGIEDGAVLLDDKDVKGPLTIGLTLTRQHKAEAEAAAEGDAEAEQKPAPATQQRVVLIGDADFLSNTFVGELGNQQLGLNLIQWLAARDTQLNINVPKAPDTSLYIPGWAAWLINLGFILILPVALIAFGVGRWIVRRRK